MKTKFKLITALAGASLFAGCATLPPGAEPGPHGTMAYHVLIEASPPGAKIEANGVVVGTTPLRLKIFGDPDGTFHDFGSSHYVVRALSLTTNQFPQTRWFGTGRWLGPEDSIPDRIYFDMNQKQETPPPVPADDYYYGPRFYFYGSPFWGPYYTPYYHHSHRHGIRVVPRHR